MSEESGLICAYVLDGQGGGRSADWSDVASWTADQGVLLGAARAARAHRAPALDRNPLDSRRLI
jgi:hypothetical protein